MKKNPKFELADKVVIYENYSRDELLSLMNLIKHIRILVCEDGTTYAWNGHFKTHEDVIRLLDIPNARGFNVGNYQFEPEEMLDVILEVAKKQKAKYKKRHK